MMERFRKQAAPMAENVAEAGAACLLTMVQGNVLLLGVGHWIIATQTGILAGALTAVALLLARTEKRWVVAVLLGVTTTIADLFVHEGGFGPAFLEALLTGVCAGVLSFAVGTFLQRWRERRERRGRPSATEPSG